VTKYMVLIPDSKPEYIEADSFVVEDHHLGFYIDGKRVAVFVKWIGVKETNTLLATVMTSTTTSTATRAKIKTHFARGVREPLILGAAGDEGAALD
jgi:hypothetical protein